MIDLETLGTGTNSVILSIGAVKFDREITDTFYVNVDAASCQRYGLTIEADTVMWWLGSEREQARNDLFKDERHDLYDALDGFAQWFGPESMPVWGNGASFDNVLLRNAFSKTNISCPWKFWHDRCYRTMKNLMPGVEVARLGTHHNAFEDAVYQTNHLLRIQEALALT